ncbi:MAG: glycosyltransferase [Opitutaceae bacterium]|nr:glycosyltransferase [Opitutaceae bacterium]
MKTCVMGVVAAWHRPELLRRLLASLHGQGSALIGIVVVDNGGTRAHEAELRAISPVPLHWDEPGENLGTGGGIARCLEAALRRPDTTHCWIMDDDMVATAGVLPTMLDAMTAARADAVSPLLSDNQGRIAWFPGPLPQPAWDEIRRGLTPIEFQARCGTAALRWNWSIWASMVVTRRAVERIGLPNPLLWYQGADIEYTLRLSARFNTVLAPAAVCQHLSPPISPDACARKVCQSLQNAAYTAVRLRHGRRILRHLPGNHFRYWRARGYSLRALGASLKAFWRGAVLGRPVGVDRANGYQSP